MIDIIEFKEIITPIFRIAALFLGILITFFSYKIYKTSIGASKGYFYMAFFGISLFIWSLTTTILKSLGLLIPEAIFGSIFLLLITITGAIAFTQLAQDFGIAKPKWLNPRIISFCIIGIFIILLLYNFLIIKDVLSVTEIMQKIMSIAHFTLALGLIIVMIPVTNIMIATKKMPWFFSFLFITIVMIAINIGAYYDGCCGIHGQMQGQGICETYDLNYMKVYEAPCNETIVTIGSFYQILIIISLIFANISFYQLWRKLS